MSLIDSIMAAMAAAPHTHKCIDQDESACADQCVRCAVQKLTELKPEGGMSLLDSLEEQKKEIERLTKERDVAVRTCFAAETDVKTRDIALRQAMDRAEKAEAACQVKQGVHPSWVNEVARLREENAALKQEARILPPAREKAMRDMMLSNNAAVAKLEATKIALGLAHATLNETRERLLSRSINDMLELLVAGAIARIDIVLADPEGRAAAEYVAALEAEHEAGRRLLADDADPYEWSTYKTAHAVVEALRTLKP